MNCSEFQDNIIGYLSNNIDPSLREQMEEHYFECQNCFKKIELMEAALDDLSKTGLERYKSYAHIDSMDIDAVQEDFGVVQGVQGVSRDGIPKIEDIRKILDDADRALAADDYVSADGFYNDAYKMAALIQDVKQIYKELRSATPEILPDTTKIVDGCEVKTRSDQNNVAVVRQKIELLKKAIATSVSKGTP